LLLLFAGGLFAATGKYQKAIDGKTLIWNSDPKAGDRVDWQGDRDKEGYGTGIGTATWYTGTSIDKLDKAAFFARYYGKMVRGKWEGPVDAHSRGKVAHAYFTDGYRTSQWAGGPAREWKGLERLPAPSKTKAIAATPEKPEPQKPEATPEPHDRPTPKPVTNVASEKPTPAPVEKPSPKETPIAEAPPVAPAPTPVVEATALVPSPTPIAEATAMAPLPTPTIEATAVAALPTPEEKIAEAAAPIPEATAEIPRPTPPEIVAAAAKPSPPTAARPKHTPPKITGKKKMQTKFDDSLRSLVGPPSTLRESSLAAATAPPESGPGGHDGSLSEKEAIELANKEVLSQGVDLSNFNSPSADYSATKEMWSVLYSAKNAVNENGVAHSLIVGVEDKTKKAYITSGK